MAVILTLVDREIITLDPIIMEWIKLESSSGTVVISAAQHRHIIERRQISSQFDADISANRLAEALGNIKYKLRSQARPYFWEVIGFANSAGRYVRVVLKLVPGDRSRSGKDELWIQTACPAGKKRLKKWLLNRTFVGAEIPTD